ncbi:MAG: T9SS type A sorting domain-containing protein [Flavobacteriales bacterium]|nr:T9SS type A sorting domain-containing protein [Flavobacteriales bacterium]
MTQKFFILTLFFLSGIYTVNAQCTPDTNIKSPGFYPSMLPEADVNVSYSEVIQFKIVKDTVVIVFGQPQNASIDSAKVQKVIGLPNGINFELNHSNKVYTPEEVGCALVSGTPTEAGTFKLGIILTIYAKVSGFPVSQTDTIKSFSIQVNGNASAEVLNKEQIRFYPNPIVSGSLHFEHQSGNYEYAIFNSSGIQIDAGVLPVSGNKIDFDHTKGVYFIELTKDGSRNRFKLIKL